MKAILIRIITAILTDAKARGKVIVAVLSVVAGLLGLMLLPVAVLSSMGNIEPPAMDIHFDEAEFLSQLPSENQAEIIAMENEGQAIADAMASLGLQEQTIKAQLIYFSCFGENSLTDFADYANLFLYAQSDEILLDSIYANYGIEIPYEDFMRSYTWTMNTTINEYMFTNPATKNTADFAAWARNAYTSSWAFKENTFGEQDSELRYRCADNVGLIMGYVRYDAENKVFTSDTVDLYYTEQGSIDTMPDVEGITVYDGVDFGIYTGSGEVIFSSAIGGCVQKSAIADGSWTSWCTVEGIEYPQEVQDAIDEIQNTTEENTEEETTGGQ